MLSADENASAKEATGEDEELLETSSGEARSKEVVIPPEHSFTSQAAQISARTDLTDTEKAILRQVEYYFSDENLPNDAHMLGLTGGSQNLPVNLGRITGFGRMRDFKPKSCVKTAIEKSTFLEFEGRKHLRRRHPCTVPPNVEPELIPGKNAPPVAVSKKQGNGPDVAAGQQADSTAKGPLMGKGSRKATGFEEYFTDPPLTPAQYIENKNLYSPDNSFSARMDTALQKYTARRKFHNDGEYLFNLWMTYGGIDCSPRQGTGRLSQADMEEMDADEIAAALAKHRVASQVDYTDKWTVDFAGVAKGFLSSHMLICRNPGPAADVTLMTTLMSNFYRWLLHNDVCPEYADDIKAALEVCKIADRELGRAVLLSAWLPDHWNRFCSAVSGGSCASMVLKEDDDAWASIPNSLSITKADAELAVVAAIVVLGTAEQRQLIKQLARDGKLHDVHVTSKEELFLQITSIDPPTPEQVARFNTEHGSNGELRPLGVIHCQRIDQRMKDRVKGDDKTYSFWIEEGIINECLVGLKLQATVCTNNIGCTWLESVRAVEASYFEIIPNEYYEREHDDILPKDWYKRQRRIHAYGYKPRSQMQLAGDGDGDGEAGAGEVAADDRDAGGCRSGD